VIDGCEGVAENERDPVTRKISESKILAGKISARQEALLLSTRSEDDRYESAAGSGWTSLSFCVN